MSQRVPFDAANDSLPLAPNRGSRLTRVTFETCPGSTLSIDLIKPMVESTDVCGVSEDAWWGVRSSDQPDREFRMFRGSHSMTQLLRRYGFQDANGCVNHKKATLHFSPSFVASEPTCVPENLLDAISVPQFYPRSGVCWFATMCWNCMANETLNRIISSHLPDDDMFKLFQRCIFDRNSAEAFRKRLWYDYTVGDDVTAPPEEDGQNGCLQFCIWCAQIGVPMYRLREKNGSLKRLDGRVTDPRGGVHTVRAPTAEESKSHILMLRFQDGDHKRFPIMRRVTYRGRRYRLTGLYMGQRKCGHQIGLTSPSGRWRDWSIADADLHKDGIGPMFIQFKGDRWRKDWWMAWKDLVHVTKFGQGHSQFCTISPHNPNNDDLGSQGSNSIDALYVPAE